MPNLLSKTPGKKQMVATAKYKIQATLCGYLASAINLGKESSRKLGMDYMTLLFNNFADFKTHLG